LQVDGYADKDTEKLAAGVRVTKFKAIAQVARGKMQSFG